MRSMTGYGTSEGKVARGVLYVEIKSINHRFSEYNIKIPPRMGALETHIRNYLQRKFQRGKVDVFFKEKQSLFGGATISVDMELAQKYKKVLFKLKKELGIKNDGDFLQTVGLDRILHIEEQGGSYEKFLGQIMKLVEMASSHVVKMQLKEGLHIRRDQQKRLSKVAHLVKSIKNQSARVLERHFDRVRTKVSGGNEGPVDDQRLQQEVAFLGSRQDIAEELVRLESHVKQYGGLLSSKEPIGRKLDFLLQEMNREANTIGAKAADAAISQMVVDCKAELERLKEQVQNVE